jgi:hypothetical protein
VPLGPIIERNFSTKPFVTIAYLHIAIVPQAFVEWPSGLRRITGVVVVFATIPPTFFDSES